MREYGAILSFVVGGFLLFLAIDRSGALRFLRQAGPSLPAVIGGGLVLWGFVIVLWLHWEKRGNDRKSSGLSGRWPGVRRLSVTDTLYPLLS